ncbi:MAG: hypothetical protein IJS26_04365 [Alphaproteobacteria bacterium]|nr:hypothetical protein [Alphaproteobacteria bacterium]
MKKVVFACLMIFALCSCTTTSVPPMRTKAKNPIEMGDKFGTKCALYILGIFGPFGNMSIPEAAAAGGVTKVTYYDITSKTYILYTKRCLNVYGY